MPDDYQKEKNRNSLIFESRYKASREYHAYSIHIHPDPFAGHLLSFRKWAVVRVGTKLDYVKKDYRSESNFYDTEESYFANKRESYNAPKRLRSQDWSVPQSALETFREGWQSSLITDRIEYIHEANKRFGKSFRNNYEEKEVLSHYQINHLNPNNPIPIYKTVTVKKEWWEDNVKNTLGDQNFGGVHFGGSRSGYGAKEAHFTKREIRSLFKGELSRVAELGKAITKMIHSTAKEQRDLLLDNLSNGSTDQEFHDFVVSPPDMTLDEMKGLKTGTGKKTKPSKIHPFSRVNYWGDQLRGVYRKQRSGGSGLSNRGASIWDQLEGVDDNQKKVYGVKWTNFTAAYIYKNFLVPGTSKMVPRKSFMHEVGDDLRERYVKAVETKMFALMKEYKRGK